MLHVVLPAHPMRQERSVAHAALSVHVFCCVQHLESIQVEHVEVFHVMDPHAPAPPLLLLPELPLLLAPEPPLLLVPELPLLLAPELLLPLLLPPLPEAPPSPLPLGWHVW